MQLIYEVTNKASTEPFTAQILILHGIAPTYLSDIVPP